LSTTEAARDLGTLIGRSRHDHEEVYVYAISYGTYWAQRYLQLYPEQASGVVLDSICPPGECELTSRFDESFNEVGRRLLEACAARGSCAQRLGEDPWEFLESLYLRLDQGHCSETSLSRRAVKQLLGTMLMHIGLRDYIPAIIYRIDRCEQADVAALDSVMSYLDSVLNVPDPYGSEVLGLHIGLSELVEVPPPSHEEASAHVESLLFSLDVGPEFAALYELWPRYPQDEYVGALADTTVPMLMMSGEFDPQTPPEVAGPAREHFVADHQTYVSVPWSAHTVLTQSPVDNIANLETCGTLLLGQFLTNPTLPLDTSCTQRVVGLDFDGLGPTASNVLFGQADAWDNQDLSAGTAAFALQTISQSSGPTPAPTVRRNSPGPL
jgi:pimeloyl-ACP methyl ester carboxylesterase